MKKFFLFSFLFIFITNGFTQNYTPESLPDSIYSGKQGDFHVQGIAIDKDDGIVYFSFTDKLVKMDLDGNLIGSVEGLVGHLGDLTYDPENKKVYASLEYKDDQIGKGITGKKGIENSGAINFYIAVFDGDKITEPKIDATKTEVLKTTYLKEVVEDYKAEVELEDRIVRHRYGASGMDGISIGPSFGAKKGKKKFLYVAYGIYGDTTRTDNDHQVILKYKTSEIEKLGKKLTQENLHESGPKKPKEKYFVKTGNTNWGIQNLEYDDYTGNFFAAVYKGSKSKFPNYRLFVIDGSNKPTTKIIESDNKSIKVKSLSLLNAGLRDTKTGIRGWNFKWGATGLFPVGNGYFYISHDKKDKDGAQMTTIYKYKWLGDDKEAFRKTK